MSADELAWTSANDLASMIRRRRLSPVELTEALLQRIERQAMGLSKHAERLKAAGRHLKRGILLHGKPGTGKKKAAGMTGGSLGNLSDGYAANQADDLASAC